jgi:hypothetical protein
VSETRFADELEIGDVFQWCGREVVVERIVPVMPLDRRLRRDPGIFIFTTVDGRGMRLHYWGYEQVTRVAP